jgi:hypothetical protein
MHRLCCALCRPHGPRFRLSRAASGRCAIAPLLLLACLATMGCLLRLCAMWACVSPMMAASGISRGRRMDGGDKGRDFVARCIGEPAAPAVVWLRIGNCTNRVLVAWLQPLLADIKSRLSRGEKIIEVRQAP